MSPEFYRVAHMVGVLMLFLGLGGMLAAVGRDGPRPPAIFPAMHGIGLLLMLVAGIGRAHRLDYGWPNWLLLKIGCWFVIALLPTLAKRGLLTRSVAVLLAIALGTVAFWLAVAKPI